MEVFQNSEGTERGRVRDTTGVKLSTEQLLDPVACTGTLRALAEQHVDRMKPVRVQHH